MPRRTGILLTAGVAALVAAARADVIIDWNNVAIDAVRATGGPPCPIARAFAMTHVAMYDAVNSIERTHYPYHVMLDAPPGTSRVAAAAAAGQRVLSHLFPQQLDVFDAALQGSLAGVPDGAGERNGIVLGRMVADAIIALRAGDGSNAPEGFEFGSDPGDYVPTPPDFTQPPFNPEWGRLKPWTMNTGAMFRPPLPPALSSAEYAAALNEVKELGRRDSTTRTQEQTQIAWFWANDRDGTFKPPGQLNHLTQVVAQQQGNTLAENARLFALVNLALAEAGIVAWDAKYDMSVQFWRPVTGVRQADRDDNPDTAADPNWLPLGDFTPPFPAYISGHATFAAAHAAVMAKFYGRDEIEFTIGTDEPIVRDVKRTFRSFSDAARENGLSRIYLGVHWRFDFEEAYKAGTSVGQYVADSYLTKLPQAEPPDPLALLCGNGLLGAFPLMAAGLVGARRRRRGG